MDLYSNTVRRPSGTPAEPNPRCRGPSTAVRPSVFSRRLISPRGRVATACPSQGAPNRIGHGYFSAAELKTLQEIIALAVFAVFSIAYLGEPLGWNHAAGFVLIAAGAFLIFRI